MSMEWSGFILFMAVSVAIGVCSVFLSRKFIGHDFLRRHNEITAPVHSAISVLFAVLLGFVIIAVWEQYNNAEEVVVAEVNQISALERDFSNYPEPFRDVIDSALTNYTRSVLDTEWKLMRSGSLDHFVNNSYEELWRSVLSLEPQNENERLWLGKAIDKMNKLDESRGKRMMYVERHIPPMLWVFLLVGGGIVILFTSLFGSETSKMSMIMIIPLSMIIGFMLYLINELDYPFTGNLHIHDEAFRHVLELLQRTP